MAGPVKTYSPEKVVVIVGGIQLTGFAEDTLVTVERSSDGFSKKVGADGEVARSFNPDRSGTITVTLMSTSDSNEYLSGLYLADEATLAGIVPVMVKDNNGLTLWSGAEGWVTKLANTELAREVNTREWKIEVANLIGFVGGSL